MNQEQIDQMAREAGFDLDGMTNMLYTVRGNRAQLEHFFRAAYAAGAAAEDKAKMQLFTDPENQPTQYGTVTVEYMLREIAQEREACARVCEERPAGTAYDNGRACAEAIRARGQA